MKHGLNVGGRSASAVSLVLPVEARTFRVEAPVGNEALHRGRVVARAQALLLVESVGFFDLGHVQLDAEARLPGNLDQAADDLQQLFCQALAVLPDSVRVDRRHAPRRGDMGEHRQRHVEMVVRMRALTGRWRSMLTRK
jgi:hypothetical protein